MPSCCQQEDGLVDDRGLCRALCSWVCATCHHTKSLCAVWSCPLLLAMLLDKAQELYDNWCLIPKYKKLLSIQPSSVFILCLSLGNWEGMHRNFLLLQQEGGLGDVWVIRRFLCQSEKEGVVFSLLFCYLCTGFLFVSFVKVWCLRCYFWIWRVSELELFPNPSLGCAWGQSNLACLNAGAIFFFCWRTSGECSAWADCCVLFPWQMMPSSTPISRGFLSVYVRVLTSCR